MKKLKESEKTLQPSIIQYLESCGAVVIKVNNTGVWNQKTQHYIPSRQRGISDILFCYKGRFGCAEIKSSGKKPTVEQLAFLDQVSTTGGFSGWYDNMDQFISEFNLWSSKISSPKMF